MPDVTTLTLPWPPSGNHRLYGNHRLTSRVVAWRQDATWETLRQKPHKFVEPVAVMLKFAPPDRRKRDLDNAAKCILDSLVANRVIKDDSGQWLPLLNLRWCDPEPGVAVYIELRDASPEVIAMLCKKPEWAER